MLLGTLQQFYIDPATFFVLLATAGLILFFVLAALVTPLLGAVTETFYALEQKSFCDKCALQITQTAFGMGLFTFFTLGTWGAYCIATMPPEMLAAHVHASVPPGQPAEMFARFYAQFVPLLFFVAPLIGLIFLCAYWSTWSVLKQRRALHLFLGWSAALSMLGALFCYLLIFSNWHVFMVRMFLRDNLLLGPLPVLLDLLPDFFSSPSAPLIFLGLVCTGLAAGASLSQLWLIMRRFKTDYGRDYYAFAMRYCARVALAFTLAATLIVGTLLLLLRHYIPAQLTDIRDLGVLSIAVGLPLACCLLWLGIAKSENPLRHKPSAFLACVFLFMALCAQLLILLSTFHPT